MKIVGIFAVLDKKLLAVQFEGEDADEFTLAFRNWQDPEYLENFFEQNRNELQGGFWGQISVEEAIWITINESEKFENYILDVAKSGSANKKSALADLVFHKLHKLDFSIKHVESKAYGSKQKSWLRLFAIKVSKELYVVSGSAIKLTRTLQEKAHTDNELEKLKITKTHLSKIGLLTEDDYDLIEITRRHEQ